MTAAAACALLLGVAASDDVPRGPSSERRLSSEWVTACGTQLCQNNHTWPLMMGSVYNGLDDPGAAVAQIAALGLNTVRVTDFLDESGRISTAPFDNRRWGKVDQLVAAAESTGLHIELDLSTYRNMLRSAGVNPYTYDWEPFLRAVVNRRNTVTGVRYGEDATIALVAFAGEVDGVFSAENNYGLTTADLTTFYRRVQSLWHAAAPRQLLTSGGLSQLYWDSGIDWRAIFSLPHNDVAAVHVYVQGDRDRALPEVAAFSAALGRPWITEEFGFPAQLGDAARANSFTLLFALNARFGAAGVGFWNVGTQSHNTYDVGGQFPLTDRAVRRWAASLG